MAITVSVVATISSTSNTNDYTTPTPFTPTAGDLLAVFVEWDTPTGSQSVGDSLGGSWTLVNTNVRSALDTVFSCYVRNSTVPASSMTVTVTDSSTGSQGCNASVLAITGANGSGSAAIRQSATAADPASIPEVSFSSACLTGNATIIGVVNSTNPSGAGTPTSWTSGSNIGHASNTSGLATAYRNSGFTGTAVTWNTPSLNDWAGIVVEIIAGSSSSASEPLPPVLTVINAIPPTLIGQGCDKTSGSQTLALTASVAAISKAIVFISMDADLTVTSVTDTKGNLYSKIVTGQTGTGDAGIAGELWVSNLSFLLAAGVDTITATFSGTRSAGCMIAMGTNVLFSTLEGTSVNASTGTTPSTSVANAVAPAYGFACVAVEGPDADGYTSDADWTVVGNTGTTGGAADSNVSINAEWIQLTTAVTTAWTPVLGTSRDYVAIEAVFSFSATEPTGSASQLLPIMGVGG